MRTKLAVAAGAVAGIGAAAVAEAGAVAVGTVLCRDTAAKRQRALLSLGQGDKDLAVECYLEVPPARLRKPEVKLALLQRHSSNTDRFNFEQDTSRNTQHAGGVLQQEQPLLAGPVEGAPLLNVALKGAFTPEPLLIQERPLEVKQLGLGCKLWGLLEQRDKYAVLDVVSHHIDQEGQNHYGRCGPDEPTRLR